MERACAAPVPLLESPCGGDELNPLCWPCYRDGFRSHNPEEPANDEEGDEESGADTPRRSEPADVGYGESTGVQEL